MDGICPAQFLYLFDLIGCAGIFLAFGAALWNHRNGVLPKFLSLPLFWNRANANTATVPMSDQGKVDQASDDDESCKLRQDKSLLEKNLSMDKVSSHEEREANLHPAWLGNYVDAWRIGRLEWSRTWLLRLVLAALTVWLLMQSQLWNLRSNQPFWVHLLAFLVGVCIQIAIRFLLFYSCVEALYRNASVGTLRWYVRFGYTGLLSVSLTLVQIVAIRAIYDPVIQWFDSKEWFDEPPYHYCDWMIQPSLAFVSLIQWMIYRKWFHLALLPSNSAPVFEFENWFLCLWTCLAHWGCLLFWAVLSVTFLSRASAGVTYALTAGFGFPVLADWILILP